MADLGTSADPGAAGRCYRTKAQASGEGVRPVRPAAGGAAAAVGRIRAIYLAAVLAPTSTSRGPGHADSLTLPTAGQGARPIAPAS